MKRKIRHKTEGWTGTIEPENEQLTWSSSHACGLRVDYRIEQNTHDPKGNYVEDPHVDSIDELEFLEEENHA